MTRRRVVRWLVSVVVVAVAGILVYNHLAAEASERVRSEVVKLADDLMIPDESRERVRGWIVDAHDEAFDAALDLTRERGKMFDEQLYVKLMFDRVVESARADGDDRLADTLERERAFLRIDVVER